MKDEIISIILIIVFFTALLYLFKLFSDWITKGDKSKEIPRRKLTRKEAEFMADYFHNKEDNPDIDGYLGNYTLPEEVMEIYKKKYSEDRKWN